MEIRNLSEKERIEARRLHRYAFGEWSDKEVKDEEITYLDPAQTIGLFDDAGTLISTVAVIDFKQCIRGVSKRMGGIAEVSTYPEGRYQGNIRKLMQYAFNQMQQNGFSVSMLAPFKDSYYEKFDYAKANAPYIVGAPQLAIRHYLSIDPGSDWVIERHRAQDVQKEYTEYFNRFPFPSYHGFVIFTELKPKIWKDRCKDSLVVFVKRNGKTEGMSRYRIQRKDPRDESTQELHIIDFYWNSLPAQSVLLNFFARHVDQISKVWIHAPFDTMVEHWFKDDVIEIKRHMPWMVRVIDVEQALKDLPAKGEDEFRIRITDKMCEWNNQIFVLRSEKDLLQVRPASGNPSAVITIKGLSALVYGSQSLEELEYLGLLQIKEEWVKHALQRWFTQLPIYSTIYF